VLFFALMTVMMVVIEHNRSSAPATGTTPGAAAAGPATATVMEREFSVTPPTSPSPRAGRCTR